MSSRSSPELFCEVYVIRKDSSQELVDVMFSSSRGSFVVRGARKPIPEQSRAEQPKLGCT